MAANPVHHAVGLPPTLAPAWLQMKPYSRSGLHMCRGEVVSANMGGGCGDMAGITASPSPGFLHPELCYCIFQLRANVGGSRDSLNGNC